MTDSFGPAFLRLTLEIEKHIPGYIDAYLGPAGLKAEVESTPPKEPAALLADWAALQELRPTKDAQRAAFSAGLLQATGGTLRILNGESLPYLEEVALLYDIHPQPVEDAQFTAAHQELDTLLPGRGTLAERNQARRKRLETPAEKLFPLMEMALQETRRRTAALVDLVPGESVELRLTSNQPWSAYNWYKGGAQSLVEFNTDIPYPVTNILGTMAHEAYPGHHTEAMLKEQRLIEQSGYLEYCSALLHSPAAVISEGIATTALEIIFPEGTGFDWIAGELLPAAGMPGIIEDAATLRRITRAQRKLRYVSGNAAIYYHTGRLNREQTIEYIETYGLTSPERAEKSFSFISSPLFRSYTFTYTQGYDLITYAAGKDSKQPLFLRLLAEPILPSTLAGANGRAEPARFPEN